MNPERVVIGSSAKYWFTPSGATRPSSSCANQLSAARASSTFFSGMVYAASPAGGEGCKPVVLSHRPPIGRLRAPANDPMRPRKVPKTKGAAPHGLIRKRDRSNTTIDRTDPH
jgi:hypothetical protein